MRTSDNELLRRYLHDRSELAFTELVERHLGMVYSAALRQVDEDAQVAEDITQSVFMDLARKGHRLQHHPTLTGWLYTSTRYLSANARRAAFRRRAHEQSAQVMNDLLRPDGPEQDWTALRPVLDEAMHDLSPGDRDAVLWRFFEKHPFAEIGLRLGVSENTARMRVERALDKLHTALVKRGITSAASVVTGLITDRAIGAVPAGLAGKVCRASFTVTGTGGILVLMAVWVTALKTKLALGFLALAAIWGLILSNRSTGETSEPLSRSNKMVPRTHLDYLPTRSVKTDVIADPEGAPPSASLSSDASQRKLQLKLVDSDTGEPMPNVRISYSGEVGAEYFSKQILSDRHGVASISFSSKADRIGFLTRYEGYADTSLEWQAKRGEVIPLEYVWRLLRAIPLGGLVVDADGVPVAGAVVEGFCPNDRLLGTPRETVVAQYKVQTDAMGHWQCQRVAPQLLRSLRIQASHPEHGPSEPVVISADLEIEQQLRAKTFTLRLTSAVVVSGVVVDPENKPVAGASIMLGRLNFLHSKETVSALDGRFQLAGVPLGKEILTATAEGYASTTVGIDVRTNSEPVRLVLSRGKPLRVRVVNWKGQPVARANVWINPNEGESSDGDSVITQLRLDGKTDEEGRIQFACVPDVAIEVNVSAPGCMELFGWQTHPGGPELVLRLGPELVVTGTVRDGLTGQLIPRFIIIAGRPEARGPYWSANGRFRLSFEGGAFQHVFNESIVSDGTNAGYVLKFEAEGYAPFISRYIAPDERLAQIDVSLRAVPIRRLLVLNPDGTPAAGAEVGFPDLTHGNMLQLVPGGFRSFAREDNALIRADAQGGVKCPDEEFHRIVAANPAGYAEADLSKLLDGVIRLQPWGRVEGILPVQEEQQGDPEVFFQYRGNESENGIWSDFRSSYRTKPDSSGRFVFPLVPPGCHLISELIPNQDERSWQHARSWKGEIHPGETIQVTLLPEKPVMPVVRPN